MALNDVVKDPVSGQEFTVSWDGRRGSAPLLEHDPHYTRQRPTATENYTRGAVVEVGLLARGSRFRASIKGQD